MEVKNKNKKAIKVGDLISVSYNWTHSIGVFLGLGNNTVQYMGIKPLLKYLQDNSKFKKWYVGGYNLEDRVLKITEDCLSDEELLQYQEIKKLLK